MKGKLSRKERLYRFYQLRLGCKADENLLGLATLEKHECGQPPLSILLGQLMIFVDIDAHHFQLACVLAGNLFQDRSHLPAWLAPFSPEFHEHGTIRLNYVRRKRRLAYFLYL